MDTAQKWYVYLRVVPRVRTLCLPCILGVCVCFVCILAVCVHFVSHMCVCCTSCMLPFCTVTRLAGFGMYVCVFHSVCCCTSVCMLPCLYAYSRCVCCHMYVYLRVLCHVACYHSVFHKCGTCVCVCVLACLSCIHGVCMNIMPGQSGFGYVCVYVLQVVRVFTVCVVCMYVCVAILYCNSFGRFRSWHVCMCVYFVSEVSRVCVCVLSVCTCIHGVCCCILCILTSVVPCCMLPFCTVTRLVGFGRDMCVYAFIIALWHVTCWRILGVFYVSFTQTHRDVALLWHVTCCHFALYVYLCICMYIVPLCSVYARCIVCVFYVLCECCAICKLCNV